MKTKQKDVRMRRKIERVETIAKKKGRKKEHLGGNTNKRSPQMKKIMWGKGNQENKSNIENDFFLSLYE